MTIIVTLLLASGMHWAMGWGQLYFWRHWQWFIITTVGFIASFATVSVVVMVAIEYYHLTMFNGQVRKVLASDDLLAIDQYYGTQRASGTNTDKRREKTGSPHPASGLWICEYNDQVIGCLALDAQQPHLAQLPSIHTSEFERAKKGTKSSGASSTKTVKSTGFGDKPDSLADYASLRHFIVMRKYRRFHIGSDLLSHALRHASSNGIKVVRAPTSSLQPEAFAMFRQYGFVGPETSSQAGRTGPAQGDWDETWRPKKQGLFGIELGWVDLDLPDWIRQQKSIE